MVGNIASENERYGKTDDARRAASNTLEQCSRVPGINQSWTWWSCDPTGGKVYITVGRVKIITS